ncbi:MAG TPA: RNA methyltransferase [Burkholderiaceae bacterium]|nr:RNA methyltransferase [Burkholderiaceae bacterium]
MTQVVDITSRDNPVLKRVRHLVNDPGACRKWHQAWLEGDHLIAAAQARGMHPSAVLVSESRRHMTLSSIDWNAIQKVLVIPDQLMKELTTLDAPPAVGALIDMPPSTGVGRDLPTVVLDRLQDAGNTGTILRCAAAFGYRQVLAIKGTASLWAPKTLRAGMGAHFGLNLVEGLSEDDLDALSVPLMVTSSHQGQWVHEGRLPWPCAWVMGHEGQGVSPGLQARAAHHIRIAQPGGEESLNVAAAAAICLYAAAPKP